MEAKMLNCSLDAIQRGKVEKSLWKQNFIIQIKLAQKESCARLAKAQNFCSGKISFPLFAQRWSFTRLRLSSCKIL